MPRDTDPDLAAIHASLASVPDPMALLVALFAHSPIGLVVLEASGRSVLSNRAFREIFGAELPAEYDVFRDEIARREGLLELVRRAFSGETVRIGSQWYDPRELEHVRIPHARRACVDATLFPLRDPEGRVTHVAVVLEDLTDETLARERAQRERAFLDAVLENAPVGIRIVDRQARFVRANPSIQAMTGRPEGEILGRPVREVVPHVDARVHDETDRVLATGETTSYEAPATLPYRPDRESWIRVRQWPVRAQGEIVGAGAIVEDVTAERDAASDRARLLESEAKARADAEIANRMKDELLATVSHELRSPISAILGWARMLGSGALDPAKAAKAIEVIERNARLQVQLIDDLLDLARAQSGALRVDAAPTDLAPVIEAALEAARPAAEAKGVALAGEVAAAPAVLADAARMQQVAANLIGNAIKFTPRGGTVSVALHAEGAYVVLRVEDTGRGIEPELLPHVFTRLRHGQVSGGLGIGLAVCQHLVELQGGTIEARSEGADQGTRMLVRMPIATETGSEGPPTDPQMAKLPRADALAGARVLVVDDDLDARELLEHLLGEHGAEVRTAAGADAALRELDAWLPDVLVSDIAMPGASGYDLVRAVRARPHDRGGALPALALTAYTRAEDREGALRAGFDQHATKPIDAAAVVSQIAALLRRAR